MALSVVYKIRKEIHCIPKALKITLQPFPDWQLSVVCFLSVLYCIFIEAQRVLLEELSIFKLSDRVVWVIYWFHVSGLGMLIKTKQKQ